MARTERPAGRITRGTTNINRLRRVDRWMSNDPRILAALTRPLPGRSGPAEGFDKLSRRGTTLPERSRPAPERSRPLPELVEGSRAEGFDKLSRREGKLSRRDDELSRRDAPLAVDLGYGGRPDTAVEMAARLRAKVPDLAMAGLEIDPDRIVPARDGVQFALGGFELAGLRPQLVRAFNVLRQYDEDEVAAAWAQICGNLAPGGYLVEGTCDEIGRRCCWVLLDADGPLELTLAWSPSHTRHPSELAPRLPKALIHRNVPGEPIHELLAAADRCWDMSAGHEPFGPRVRWQRALEMMRDAGMPVAIPRGRRVDNLLTVPWDAVRPNR